MALTEKTRMALQGKGFDGLYNAHVADWTDLANGARALIRPHVQGGEPTVDDIKEVLLPLVELHDHYRTFLAAHPKLTQLYWSSYFTDYLLHRVYQPRLNIDLEEEGDGDD